ncbi:MAG: hypothetical protein FWF28_04620, partial [Micrococcales bacterium]|nr:hypothetical protein [Micrococcales bacterium]
GIAELAVMIGLVDPGDAELCEMRDEALKCVDDANPDVGPVGRFVTWMGERVKDGSNAAVAAVIAAVVSGLVSDAETLAHALGH